MKRNLIIYLVLLFACLAPMQAQKAISTQEQVIENNVRLNELEKKVDAQDKEMQSVSDKKQADLESKLELKKENLESKSNWVNYLLGILGILIAFFGIGIPIAAFYYGRKFLKEIDEEKEKAKKELEIFKEDFKDNLELLIKNSKERVLLLEEKAQVSITNLCKYEQDGQESAKRIKDNETRLNNLIEKSNDPNLTRENKEDLATKARELSIVKGLSDYEKEYAKAMELYYKDDYQNALDKLLLILNSYPDKITMEKLSEIYFSIAYLYGKIEDIEKLFEYNNKAIEIYPKHAGAWYNKGVYFLKKEKNIDAQMCFEKAVEIKPDFEDALFNLGICFRKNHNNLEALKFYTKLLNKNPNYKDAWHNMGLCYNDLKEYDKAIESDLKALEIDPNFADSLCNLGYSYNAKGDSEKAIEYYKLAIDKNKELFTAYLNLIEIYLFTAQLDEANKYIKKASTLKLKNEFNIFILKVFYSIMINSWSKNIDETFEEIKELIKISDVKPEWSFEEMKNWLSSDKSKFISDDQRTFITELIRLIEEWRTENKKP